MRHLDMCNSATGNEVAHDVTLCPLEPSLVFRDSVQSDPRWDYTYPADTAILQNLT